MMYSLHTRALPVSRSILRRTHAASLFFSPDTLSYNRTKHTHILFGVSRAVSLSIFISLDLPFFLYFLFTARYRERFFVEAQMSLSQPRRRPRNTKWNLMFTELRRANNIEGSESEECISRERTREIDVTNALLPRRRRYLRSLRRVPEYTEVRALRARILLLCMLGFAKGTEIDRQTRSNGPQTAEAGAKWDRICFEKILL